MTWLAHRRAPTATERVLKVLAADDDPAVRHAATVHSGRRRR